MITNERQHRITRAEIKRFEQAIASAQSDEPAANVDPRLHAAMIDGLRSQLDELRDEVHDYEALRDGEIQARALTSLLDLPRTLIEGRIAGRLTQRELGTRLGVAEQQIQRYERTGYAGASIERLQEVADALGLTFKETVQYHVPGRSQRGGRMATRKTGKAAATAAGKTLASKTASKTAKRAAASDLAQVRSAKVTSSSAASAAGKTLASKSASKTVKTAAASDLSQAARKKR